MEFEKLIASLGRFGCILPSLVADVCEADAKWKPESGGWSILEIVCHLVDEEVEDFRIRVQSTLADPTMSAAPTRLGRLSQHMISPASSQPSGAKHGDGTPVAAVRVALHATASEHRARTARAPAVRSRIEATLTAVSHRRALLLIPVTAVGADRTASGGMVLLVTPPSELPARTDSAGHQARPDQARGRELPAALGCDQPALAPRSTLPPDSHHRQPLQSRGASSSQRRTHCEDSGRLGCRAAGLLGAACYFYAVPLRLLCRHPRGGQHLRGLGAGAAERPRRHRRRRRRPVGRLGLELRRGVGHQDRL